MEIRNLALLRFDFIIGEESEQLIRNLEETFGEPETSLAWLDIRDNEQKELVFRGSPGLIGASDFDSLTVRVVESTDAVTEIITLATIESERLEKQDSAKFVQCQQWEHQIGNIRTFIPGREQGIETTVWWVKAGSPPDEIRDPPVDLVEVHEALSKEEAHEFLEIFNVNAGRGFIALEENTLLIPGDPGKITDRLIAIDLAENVSVATAFDGSQLPGDWSALSILLGIHYWCRVMGKRLEEFEEGLEDADTELPSDNGEFELNEYLALDATIFELQDEWIPLHSQISRELRQLSRQLKSYSVEFDELSRRQIQDESIRDEPGVLETYINQLDTELDRVRFDSDRLDISLESLSTAFHNRVSLVATRENIDLQQRVSDQTDESLSLQSKVFLFTMLVGVLTVVLVADASMSGGLEQFIDRFFNEGLAAFTPQVLTGIGLLLLVSVLLVAYFKGVLPASWMERLLE